MSEVNLAHQDYEANIAGFKELSAIALQRRPNLHYHKSDHSQKRAEADLSSRIIGNYFIIAGKDDYITEKLCQMDFRGQWLF